MRFPVRLDGIHLSELSESHTTAAKAGQVGVEDWDLKGCWKKEMNIVFHLKSPASLSTKSRSRFHLAGSSRDCAKNGGSTALYR